MNEKEIAEIRRRFNPQKTNITCVHGCLVNEKHEITAEINQPLATLTADEAELLLTLLKKLLSGKADRNLLNIEFTNEEVLHGETHKRLLTLRDTSLNDEAALKRLYADIVGTVRLDGSYLILAASDRYDVFTYTSDNKKDYDSTELFAYFVCGVFPVKMTKPQLSFTAFENTFKNLVSNAVLSSPELGFMFPSFDDRASNIYNAVFYTKDSAADRSELIGRLFAAKAPMPALLQRETFSGIIKNATAEESNLEIIKSIRDEIDGMLLEHKESREKEPLAVSRDDMCDILRSCEVSENGIETFKKEFDESFGEKARLNPQNLIETKKLEITGNDISIKINPEHGDILKARVIDGVKYLLIRADGEIEVNGVAVNI